MTISLTQIDFNYRFKLGSYLSIKNHAELYEVRRREFQKYRAEEFDKFAPLQKEITEIFRKRLKAND